MKSAQQASANRRSLQKSVRQLGGNFACSLLGKHRDNLSTNLCGSFLGLSCEIIENAPAPHDLVIIIMHGYGADMSNLSPIGQAHSQLNIHFILLPRSLVDVRSQTPPNASHALIHVSGEELLSNADLRSKKIRS